MADKLDIKQTPWKKQSQPIINSVTQALIPILQGQRQT